MTGPKVGRDTNLHQEDEFHNIRGPFLPKFYLNLKVVMPRSQKDSCGVRIGRGEKKEKCNFVMRKSSLGSSPVQFLEDS